MIHYAEIKRIIIPQCMYCGCCGSQVSEHSSPIAGALTEGWRHCSSIFRPAYNLTFWPTFAPIVNWIIPLLKNPLAFVMPVGMTVAFKRRCT